MANNIFASVTDFHTAFIAGLDNILASDALAPATFNLVFGNAILHHREREFLERLEVAKTRLAAEIDLKTTDDDTQIFLKLKDMKLDWQNWTMIEDKKINSWNVQLNKFRVLKPKGVGEKPITNIYRPFDANDFNFNQIKDPTIWQGDLGGHRVSLYYNKFPYKDLQALLILDPSKNKPQFLTPEDHQFVWDTTTSLSRLYNVSFGFNSLGASASVNHLHFHLMVGIEKLPVADDKWLHNGGPVRYPANIYVYDNAPEAWGLIDRLNQKNIAYNILYLPGKVYIFPRKFLGTYPNVSWSIGFGWYQFSGNFIVYDEDTVNNLTEEIINQALVDASIKLEEEKIMDRYVFVAKLKDIKENEPHCAEVEGKSIALFKINGGYYATTGVCTHAGGPLCQGEVHEGIVTCPWHGSRYEVVSGQVIHGPSKDPIKIYKTRVDGDDLQINLV